MQRRSSRIWMPPRILNRADLRTQALGVLEFLWDRCRSADEGMYHCFDEGPRAPGLLIDQARMGMALVQAFHATGKAVFLERAKELAKIIVSRLANPKGGYFDRGQSELAFFGAPLTLIDQNGVAASFFLRLAAASGEPAYRDAALRALGAFSGDFAAHGIDAAPYGHALSEFFA